VFYDHAFSESSYSGSDSEEGSNASNSNYFRSSSRLRSYHSNRSARDRSSNFPGRTTRNSLATGAHLLGGLPMVPRADLYRNNRRRIITESSGDEDSYEGSFSDDSSESKLSYSDSFDDDQIESDEKLAKRIAAREARELRKSNRHRRRGKRGRPGKKVVHSVHSDDEAASEPVQIIKSATRGWGARQGLRTVPLATEIDRDICYSDVLSETQYYPQLGDVVMYFPQGHANLLQVNYVIIDMFLIIQNHHFSSSSYFEF